MPALLTTPEIKPDRSRRATQQVIVTLVIFMILGVVLLLTARQRSLGPRPTSLQADTPASVTDLSDGHSTEYPVTIRQPAGPRGVTTGLRDAQGRPITVACNTCHSIRPANLELRVGQAPSTFHQGLTGAHGNLTCVSCHDPRENYQTLRLADGIALPFTDVMRLCAQCHGPQYRDYQHGAHGGMNGYWDLTLGPRTRNNCIDCHDPHAPRYPVVHPAPGPLDRFVHPDPRQQGAGHE